MILLVLTTTIVGLPILVLFYWYALHTKLMQSESKIPFLPGHLPLIGHLTQLRHWNDFYGKQMSEYYAKFGDTVGVYMGMKRFVFTRDVKVVEELMSSPKLIDKPWTYRIIEKIIGEGIFTSAGELWKKRRRQITPAFHFDILKGFLEVMEHRSIEANDILNKLEREGEPFDCNKLCASLTLSVICETSMGLDYKVKDMMEGSKFETLFKGVSVHFINKVLYPWYRNQFIYGLTSDGKSMDGDVQALKDFVYEIIEKRIAFRKSQKDQEQETDTSQKDQQATPPPSTTTTTSSAKSRRKIFIDIMLDAYEKGEIDIHEIITEVNTFVIAGYDTTANTLSWTLYLLGRNKEKQDLLYKELKESGLQGRPLKMEELSQLRYLDSVIKETQRLMPAITRIGRSIPAGTSLGGTVFPDCNISVDIMGMNRNPNLWKDPMSYLPERFLKSETSGSASNQGKDNEEGTSNVGNNDQERNGKTSSPSSITKRPSSAYSFIPFSAGPRNCIGQRFALNELRASLFHMITKYEVTATQSQEELDEDFSFFHKSDNGLMLTVKSR